MCFRPATVQQDKRCPLCGNSNDELATMCSACGSELPDAPAIDTPAQAGARMPGAFGDSGTPGGGFQPRVPKAPGSPAPPPSPIDPPKPQL